MSKSALNIAELEKSLQTQIERINETIIKLRHNILVDIGFMDKDVAALCKQILGAEDMGAKMLEPKMIEMINKLDELAAELKDYQDRINPDGTA